MHSHQAISAKQFFQLLLIIRRKEFKQNFNEKPVKAV